MKKNLKGFVAFIAIALLAGAVNRNTSLHLFARAGAVHAVCIGALLAISAPVIVQEKLAPHCQKCQNTI